MACSISTRSSYSVSAAHVVGRDEQRVDRVFSVSAHPKQFVIMRIAQHLHPPHQPVKVSQCVTGLLAHRAGLIGGEVVTPYVVENIAAVVVSPCSFIVGACRIICCFSVDDRSTCRSRISGASLGAERVLARYQSRIGRTVSRLTSSERSR
jgi:hypothetical protein